MIPVPVTRANYKRMKLHTKILLLQVMLSHDMDFQVKCLELLYRKQTPDEQQMETSVYQNEQGFNSADAAILSVIAEDLRHGNGLTPRDRDELSVRLPKYAKQLEPLIPDEELG